MRYAKLPVIVLALAFVACSFARPAQAEEPPVFGLMADVQYADLDTAGARHYRTALVKLEDCVADFSKRELAFVIQLGDIVNGHGKDVEKSIADLDRILPVFNKLPMPKYHVVGNHCLTVGKEALGHKLGLERFYYEFTVPSAKGWRFVVLDGNDAGYGVIGDEQVAWFRSTIDKAAEAGEKVICFCHFALLPEAAKHHRMAKPEPILEIMDKAGCVVAWFAGHDHAGGYAVRKGVHHVTVRGMVESPVKNAYAVITLYEDKIVEVGFGDEPSREMPFSPPHENAEWWIGRAMYLANSPEGADAHDDVMITLAESLALSGDLSRFWALAQDVKDQEKMRHYLSVIAHHLVVAGRIDEANQIVARLDSEAERERAAQQLAWAFARRHDFDMAAQTAAKIQNRGTRNHALEKIIEAQAESGRWDDALTTLDQIAVSDDMDSDEKESVAKDKTALLALILRYRAENVSRPPETPSTDAASRYRALLALWGLGSTIDDVDRARGLADKLTDPEELATAWRGIAWYYAQKDARDEALDALSRGTAAARKIAEPFAKSLNLVLLADIYLELGDRESAVSLIPEALSSEENMMKLMRGLTSFTTGPAIIGVLVRSGHTDRALQMLHAAKSEPATSWIAFGEFCAETRQLDLAASLLKEQGTATSKAWLALGVATILITDRGKAVKPTAPNDAK